MTERLAALSLPADILQQSCKRVGVLGAALAGLWALGLATGNLIPSITISDPAGRAVLWPLPGSAVTGAAG